MPLSFLCLHVDVKKGVAMLTHCDSGGDVFPNSGLGKKGAILFGNHFERNFY